MLVAVTLSGLPDYLGHPLESYIHVQAASGQAVDLFELEESAPSIWDRMGLPTDRNPPIGLYPSAVVSTAGPRLRLSESIKRSVAEVAFLQGSACMAVLHNRAQTT